MRELCRLKRAVKGGRIQEVEVLPVPPNNSVLLVA